VAVWTADLGLRSSGHSLLQHTGDHHPQSGARSQTETGRGRRADVTSALTRTPARPGQIADSLGSLVLEVPIHTAHGFHAGTLVNTLLYVVGRRYGIDDEVHHGQAVLGEVLPDAGLETGSQFVEVAGQIENRVEGLTQDVRQPTDYDATEEVLNLEIGIDAPGPDDLDHEQFGIGNLEGVDTVRAQPDHLELRVPEQDGLNGAPLEIQESPLAHEEDIAPEGRVPP